MTLPDWMTRTAPPSPPAGSPPAPRLRYVVDLPASDSARALVEMARCVLRAEAATAAPVVASGGVLLPAPVLEEYDDGAAQTLCTQFDHEPEATP